MFTSAPVLFLPYSKKQFIVDVNTFDTGVKVVLPITVSNYVLFLTLIIHCEKNYIVGDIQ